MYPGSLRLGTRTVKPVNMTEADLIWILRPKWILIPRDGRLVGEDRNKPSRITVRLTKEPKKP